VRIFHETVRATDEPGDQVRAILVYNIVMRSPTGVPQGKASPQKVTYGEDREPLGSNEPLRSNRLPAKAVNLHCVHPAGEQADYATNACSY
jgi:hypothetical protein